MYFSSMIFLWLFLPITIFVYFIMQYFGKRFQWGGNAVLLAASLIFYAWGEPVYILLLLLSVILNYIFGLLMEERIRVPKKMVLFCAVFVNLGALAFFKYSNFIIDILNPFFVGRGLPHSSYELPLGISFYTFQAMSYVIDVYRNEVKAQKNFWHLLLYISLFPQLVAGPIVKYKDIERQIVGRSITRQKQSYGVKRFIYGLGKKVLLSNILGKYADYILNIQTGQLSTGLAWLAMVLYAFQIYYDFSGYSDMAIGLGSMFGFELKENFNYPYIAQSIREFWQRWHISLSSWFREYVYIPLGGNRKGTIRTYINLFAVFFLTGLWHGASFNFVVWGLFHGCFMVFERFGWEKILEKNPIRLFNHFYAALVVVCGWVFFRIETVHEGLAYLKVMFVYQKGEYGLSDCLNMELITTVLLSVLLCGILQSLFPKFQKILCGREENSIPQTVFLFAVLCLCIISLSADAYNPFIYFRF